MVEGGGLESRCTGFPYRGFESRPLRHFLGRRESRVKLGTKAYIAAVLILPWLGFLPMMANERDVIWYALPVGGPPLLIGYTFVTRNTQYILPNLPVYFAYFALLLLPLRLHLNRRGAPTGQVVTGVLVGLSLATHVALVAVSYLLWRS